MPSTSAVGKSAGVGSGTGCVCCAESGMGDSARRNGPCPEKSRVCEGDIRIRPTHHIVDQPRTRQPQTDGISLLTDGRQAVTVLLTGGQQRLERRMLKNVWVRATVIHPLGFVAAAIAAVWLADALGGIDTGRSGVGLVLCGAALSLVATAVMVAGRRLSGVQRGTLVAANVVATLLTIALAWISFLYVVLATCPSGVECL